MAKVKNKVRVSFPSPAAENVTGSMILVESSNLKILLDAGLYQSASPIKQYQANTRKFPFKAKEIDYIFISHLHCDHSALLPRLVKEGFCGRVITTKGFSNIYKIMAYDSASIMKKELDMLQRQYKKPYELIYSEGDINDSLDLIDEYDFGEEVKLNDDLTFRLYRAGHILGSAQIKLWIREGNQVKTIGYTGDIGHQTVPQFYTEDFEPMNKLHLLIGEATYSRSTRNTTKKDRDKDLEKIREIVKMVCCENHKRLLIPTFSLSRSQNLVTHLYNIFGKDENFNIPIYIDSPLTVEICKAYLKQLQGEDLEQLKNALEWKNVKLISEYSDSVRIQADKSPAIILSSSGMMNAGRSVAYAKILLGDTGNHILFCGFSVENSLAAKIRDRKQKTVTIEKKKIPNRAAITELHSFSSHGDKECLLKYYSTVNADKIALVHSEQDSKIIFAKELKEKISKRNKTSKVIAVNYSTEILV